MKGSLPRDHKGLKALLKIEHCSMRFSRSQWGSQTFQECLRSEALLQCPKGAFLSPQGLSSLATFSKASVEHENFPESQQYSNITQVSQEGRRLSPEYLWARSLHQGLTRFHGPMSHGLRKTQTSEVSALLLPLCFN